MKIKLAQACTIAVHENLRSTGHSLVRFKVRPGAWTQYGLTLSGEMSPAMEVCDVGVAGELCMRVAVNNDNNNNSH